MLNKKILAIDFDGTITLGDNRIWDNNEYINDIMVPNIKIINWLKNNSNKFYYILWSCRCGKALDDAVKFCNDNGIFFDAINKNILPYETSNKIIADYYLDDRSINVKDIEDI